MRLILCLLVLVLSACGSDNTLSGSVSDIMKIDFDQTVFFSQGAFLTIEYKKASDVVCEIAVDSTDANLGSGAQVSGADFLKRVTLSRATSKQDNFAATLGGAITFTSFSLSSGQKIAGNFNAVLTDGHTLLGKFSGSLK